MFILGEERTQNTFFPKKSKVSKIKQKIKSYGEKSKKRCYFFTTFFKITFLQIDNFVRTKFMNYESNISDFDLEIQFPWFSLTVFRFKKIIVSSETWEFSDLWNLFKNTWFDYQKFVQTSTQSKLSMDWKNVYKFLFGRIIWILFQGLSP